MTESSKLVKKEPKNRPACSPSILDKESKRRNEEMTISTKLRHGGTSVIHWVVLVKGNDKLSASIKRYCMKILTITATAWRTNQGNNTDKFIGKAMIFGHRDLDENN